MNAETCRGTGAFTLAGVSIVLVLLFLGAHVGGWRDQVNVLSGVHSGTVLEQLQGYCYCVFYLLLMMVAPVLAIAAALLKAFGAWSARARREASAVNTSA